MTQEAPPAGADIEGKTRAELLEMCRARGLAATAWKKERMEQALLTGEQPARRPAREPAQRAAIAEQLEERESGAEAAKALASRLLRTGRCLSTTCEIGCQGYEEGARDAFRWQLCTCGHTQWAHEKQEPGAVG